MLNGLFGRNGGNVARVEAQEKALEKDLAPAFQTVLPTVVHPCVRIQLAMRLCNLTISTAFERKSYQTLPVPRMHAKFVSFGNDLISS